MNSQNMAFVLEAAAGATSKRAIREANNILAGDKDPKVDFSLTDEQRAGVHDRIATAKKTIAGVDKRAKSDPFAKAAAESVEVGILVPSLFRAALERAGFRVVDDKAAVAEYGFASLGILTRVLIVDPKTNDIVAMGASDDAGDAIVHAALGYFREHPVEGVTPTAGIAQAPSNPLT